MPVLRRSVIRVRRVPVELEEEQKEGSTPMRIGLPEDNPAIVDLFISTFTLEGYAVETHSTGVSLFERLLPGGRLPLQVRGASPHPCRMTCSSLTWACQVACLD